MEKYVSLVAEGFGNTLLIVVASCVLPLLVGALLTFFASKSSVAAKIFHWISLPIESVTPTALLLALYFAPSFLDLFTLHRALGEWYAVVIIIITFMLCFIGYMPARYRSDFSFVKNLLYNGCGLISTLIKWSVIAGYVGCMDLLKASQQFVAVKYEFTPLIIAYCILFGMVFIFELAKRLINQFMK